MQWTGMILMQSSWGDQFVGAKLRYKDFRSGTCEKFRKEPWWTAFVWHPFAHFVIVVQLRDEFTIIYLIPAAAKCWLPLNFNSCLRQKTAFASRARDQTHTISYPYTSWVRVDTQTVPPLKVSKPSHTATQPQPNSISQAAKLSVLLWLHCHLCDLLQKLAERESILNGLCWGPGNYEQRVFDQVLNGLVQISRKL